jgi:hypothetical protein
MNTDIGGRAAVVKNSQQAGNRAQSVGVNLFL